ACSPLATNAIGGDIWDNFSSQSYKDLPSVGKIKVHHPITGKEWEYTMPAGGRGYTRVPSLISLWSTAPFLQNNSVGRFESSPSVEARMRSFNSSIEQMLWPEKRDKDKVLGGKVPGLIDRTTSPSYLRVASGYLPALLRPVLDVAEPAFPAFIGDKGIELGPIPEGTPINLLANPALRPPANASLSERAAHDKEVLDLVVKILKDLRALGRNADDAKGRQVFANVVEPLLKFSKCPDFVVNRGHYFGTSLFAEEPGLSDGDKRALV